MKENEKNLAKFIFYIFIYLVVILILFLLVKASQNKKLSVNRTDKKNGIVQDAKPSLAKRSIQMNKQELVMAQPEKRDISSAMNSSWIDQKISKIDIGEYNTEKMSDKIDEKTSTKDKSNFSADIDVNEDSILRLQYNQKLAEYRINELEEDIKKLEDNIDSFWPYFLSAVAWVFSTIFTPFLTILGKKIKIK